MMTETAQTSRVRVALVAVALAAAMLVTTAGPALAGSACNVWGDATYTDGVWAYSQGYVNCGGVSGTLAVKIRASVQEKAGFYWTVRSNHYNYSSGTNSTLSAVSYYNCNGHGTDNYKTRATGYDDNEDNRTEYSGESQLTC